MTDFYSHSKVLFKHRLLTSYAEAAMTMATSEDKAVTQDSPEVQQRVFVSIMSDMVSHTWNSLMWLEALEDPRNDQLHAAARDFFKLLAKRVGIDAKEKYGITLE